MASTLQERDIITAEGPATTPDPTNPDGELVEAVDWLMRAGVMSGERPAFSHFFEELAESHE